MFKLMIPVAGALALALAFPSAFEAYRRNLAEHQPLERVPPSTAPIAAAAEPGPPPAPAGRTTRLTADPDGHFRTSARFDGRSIDTLIDTGATYVAMSEATALRLGLHLAPQDFRYTASTANGEAAVARTVIGRIEVGRVAARDVDALVIRGNGLGTVLLGMSFLNKLTRFEAGNGRLDLVQ